MKVSSNESDSRTVRVTLDVGEHEKDVSDSLLRRQLQTHFLTIISQTYPRALEDLLSISDDYWDFAVSYLEENNVPYPPKITLGNIIELCPSWEMIKVIKQADPIRSKLLIWAQRHNLNAEWCLDRAIKTLQLWAVDENIRSYLGWYIYFDEAFLHKINEAKQDPESILHNWQALLCNDDLLERRPLPLPSADDLQLMKAMIFLVYQDDGDPTFRTPRIETREAYVERARLLARYDVESTRLRKGKHSSGLKLVDSVVNQTGAAFLEAAKVYDRMPGWRRVAVKSILLRDLVMAEAFR